MTPETLHAARWLFSHSERHANPILPTIRRQFGLTAAQAIDAIREANRQRASEHKE